MTMLDAGMSSPAWTIAGWTMLHFLWAGGLIGLLAAAGRRLLRPAAAELQYAYALGCLAALAAAPPIIAALLVAAEGTASRPPALAAAPLAIRDLADAAPILAPEAPAPEDPAPPLPPKLPEASSLPRPARDALATVAAYLPFFWLLGTPLTFASLAFGLAGAERLRREGRAITDPEWVALARRLADSIGVTRRVALATCDRLAASPVLIGILRPAILFPPAALTGWTPEQVEVALLHELAHVRRRDNLVILAQRIVESLLFFHPAVWIVSGWAHREREHCCDRAVVRLTGRPIAYAEALLALATRKPSRGPAATAMAEGPLVVRIRRLLNAEVPAMKLPRTTVALTTGFLCIPFLLVGARAAFSGPQENPPETKAPDPSLRQAIAELAQAANAPEGSKFHPDDLQLIARAQIKSGDREGAYATLRKAARIATEAKPQISRTRDGKITYVTHTPFAPYLIWNVGHLQAELGDKAGALETLRLALRAAQEMPADGEDKGIIINENTETLIGITKDLKSLGAREEVQEALDHAARLIDTLKIAFNDQHLMSYIVGIHAAAGDIEGAFKLIEPVVASEKTSDSSRFLLGSLYGQAAEALDTTDRAEARKTLDRLYAGAIAADEPRRKAGALNQIAIAYTRIGDFAKAMEIARSIGDGPQGTDFDAKAKKARTYDLRGSRILTMISIAREQWAAGDREGMRRILHEAYEATKALPEAMDQPGRFGEIAALMVLAGDLPGALLCAEKLQPDHRGDTLALIASARRRAGDDEAARATFRRALESAEASRHREPQPGADSPSLPLAPGLTDAQRDAIVTRKVAKIRAMMGDYGEAQKAAESLPDRDRLHTLEEIARTRAASGDAEGALEWARGLDLPSGSERLLAAIARGIDEADLLDPPK